MATTVQEPTIFQKITAILLGVKPERISPDVRDTLLDILKGYSERDLKILVWRELGNWTLEAIGQEFNLSKERIRQIEKHNLKRLRHYTKARQLKQYLQEKQ